MTKTLGLIHTSATLVPVFQELINKYLAGKDLKIFNIVDDSLIKNTIERGAMTPDTARRVVDYVGSAEAAGADFILVTCSSIGAAVESSAPLTGVPVLRVDQPMADKAVQMGTKIGVVATLSTTLEPTSDLVRRRAIVAGKEIELTSKLCEGAFDALMGGKPEVHDESVASALKELAQQVEVIVLAQASMARVVDQLSEEDKKVPILTSPELAMQHLAAIL
ncbi:aspartate/glutamate racemase family protein [Prolixibacteraceae bacterium Z1-6]|uniref:Aspartate/glutamate racemase family protein n=1 Tax=Draconibacterium aestuarii TaxID=2998507 RepID=A0A9X3F7P4_9BACT|nr:aspartate/glutamate racemase family protein [Prolixibacteraceae bacterium Z1-6]